MDRTEKVIFTNMCMIYDERGNVLVQNRLDPNWSGITFPGGHTERGESFTDSVIREVFEETGLTVSELQICGVKDKMIDENTRFVVLLYKTNRFKGELVSSDEGDVFWAPLKDLPNMKLAPSMELMLKVFSEENATEMFFSKENNG